MDVVPPPRVRRHDPDDPYLVVAADKGTAAFSDYANAISAEYGYWLGRCVRVGRLGRLRPQGDGHHGARRVGVGQAPLPRNGHRHADDRLHRRGDRRHVRRRVRQRHAAVAPHQARRGLRPSAHLARSRSGSGNGLPRARAALPAAAFVVERLRRDAALAGRRHPFARRQVDCDHARGASRAGDHRGSADAVGTGQCDPEGAGRSRLQRRHRDLRKGHVRDARAGRRPRERRAARERARPAVQGVRRRRQSRLHAARAHRVRAGGRADQHRCHRQFGRRRHLGPRGQHQDPAGPGRRARASSPRSSATRCWPG